MTEETENRALIVRGKYDLTVPERALIKRGLLLADSLAKKEYICPILGAKFVLIPAGTFIMGSPEDKGDFGATLHQVTISKPFYLQTTLVTQGQWEQMMGSNPSYFQGDENLPVDQVSWNDVQDFIGRLNRQEGTDKYRLPTEAEWEYACRAGNTTAYCFGDDPCSLGEYAWYRDNSEEMTHPVGQKKPNAWGLHDMHGNVWEWVKDVWEWVKDGDEDYQSGSAIDPEGPLSGSLRVYRGGYWASDAEDCRSAVRAGDKPGLPDRDDPFWGYGACGFRLLKAVEQAGQVRTRLARVHSSGTGVNPSRGVHSKQSKLIKKQLSKSKRQFIAKVRETSQDGDFVTHNKGTFLDTRTNLMWSGEDNGFDIDWQDAKRYCENYRGGGYTDWRMPTWNELAGLYESRNYKNVIQISGLFVLASETSGSAAATFDFNCGLRCWGSQSGGGGGRALPVRSGK